MHEKIYLYINRDSVLDMVQKPYRVLWPKAHLKWKRVLESDESKFDILVGNHKCCVLRTKKEGELPGCYQRSVQKPHL